MFRKSRDSKFVPVALVLQKEQMEDGLFVKI